MELAAESPGSTGASVLEALSARELEVLRATALGLTNPQLADRLGVSVHAIKFHLGSIYRKLAVTNRTEAVVLFVRESGPRPLVETEA